MNNKKATTQNIDYKDMLFMEYANGSMDSANTALISAYLTLNPDERALMGEYEAMSASISLSDEQACSSQLFEQTLALLDKEIIEDDVFSADQKSLEIQEQDKIPAPIIEYALSKNKAVKFSPIVPGYDRAVLSHSEDSIHAELLKIAPNKPVAEHGHNSLELTLILDGAFEDETGYYGKGSLIICDENVEHQPITDKLNGCLCFTTRSKPLQYKGGIGKILNMIFKS